MQRFLNDRDSKELDKSIDIAKLKALVDPKHFKHKPLSKIHTTAEELLRDKGITLTHVPPEGKIDKPLRADLKKLAVYQNVMKQAEECKKKGTKFVALLGSDATWNALKLNMHIDQANKEPPFHNACYPECYDIKYERMQTAAFLAAIIDSRSDAEILPTLDEVLNKAAEKIAAPPKEKDVGGVLNEMYHLNDNGYKFEVTESGRILGQPPTDHKLVKEELSTFSQKKFLDAEALKIIQVVLDVRNNVPEIKAKEGMDSKLTEDQINIARKARITAIEQRRDRDLLKLLDHVDKNSAKLPTDNDKFVTEYNKLYQVKLPEVKKEQSNESSKAASTNPTATASSQSGMFKTENRVAYASVTVPAVASTASRTLR